MIRREQCPKRIRRGAVSKNDKKGAVSKKDKKGSIVQKVHEGGAAVSKKKTKRSRKKSVSTVGAPWLYTAWSITLNTTLKTLSARVATLDVQTVLAEMSLIRHTLKYIR